MVKLLHWLCARSGKRLRAGRSRVKILIRARDFVFFRMSRSGSGSRPTSSSIDNGGPSREGGGKRPEREADKSSVSVAEFNNWWNYTSAPHYATAVPWIETNLRVFLVLVLSVFINHVC